MCKVIHSHLLRLSHLEKYSCFHSLNASLFGSKSSKILKFEISSYFILNLKHFAHLSSGILEKIGYFLLNFDATTFLSDFRIFSYERETIPLSMWKNCTIPVLIEIEIDIKIKHVHHFSDFFMTRNKNFFHLALWQWTFLFDKTVIST